MMFKIFSFLSFALLKGLLTLLTTFEFCNHLHLVLYYAYLVHERRASPYTRWSWKSRDSVLNNQISICFLEGINFQKFWIKLLWHFGHFFMSSNRESNATFAFVTRMGQNKFRILIKRQRKTPFKFKNNLKSITAHPLRWK